MRYWNRTSSKIRAAIAALFLAAALAGLAAVPTFAAAPTSAADSFNAIVYDSGSGRCLDSNYQGAAYTLPCNGGNYQLWTVRLAPVGQNFVDVQTGLCLDSRSDGDLHTQGCNGYPNQEWIQLGSTSYYNNATGWCLDSNDNGNAYTYLCDGTSWESWPLLLV